MTLIEIIGNQYVTIHKQEERIAQLENQKAQLEEQVKKLTSVDDAKVTEVVPA